MMSQANVTSSRRRRREDDQETTEGGNDAADTRKRRMFLQTMGQQLREFGNDAISPQDPNRTPSGISPESHRPIPQSATELPSSRPMGTPDNDNAPGEEDEMPAGAAESSSKWLWKAGEVQTDFPNGHPPTVKFDDLIDWSQSYFDNWHPAFPFLHAPTLLEYFRSVTQGLPLPSVNPPSNTADNFRYVILRSVMSISVADRRQMNSLKPIPSNLVFGSFQEAITSIQMVLTEESSILSLQALLCVQLFLVTMHRYNAASRLLALTVRMSFQLSLNKCPGSMQTLPEKEIELRKRIFWSMFCLDRYVCIRLGTPLGIRSDDTNVCYPRHERHQSPHESTEPDDRLSLIDFLARHATIRGSIVKARNETTIHGNKIENDYVTEVEAEHTKWWNLIDEHISESEQTSNIAKAHQITLIVLRFETILALHRSVLAAPKKDAAYNAALQRCIFAARSVINTLYKALQGVGAFDGSPGQAGYEPTPLVWPSFTWAVWMSFFVIFSAFNEGQVTGEITVRLAERSIAVMKNLALRGTSWPDACIVAIQNLKTRIQAATSSQVLTDASVGRNAPETRASNRHPQESYHTHRHQAEQPRSGYQTPRGGAIMLPPGNYGFPSASYPAWYQHNSQYYDTSGSVDAGDRSSQMQQPLPHPQGHFAGAGNFLGIAQQTSDNPLSTSEIMHLFNGEDVAHCFGDDGAGGYNNTSFFTGGNF